MKMTLIETLKADQLAARIAKNTILAETLTTLYSDAAMIGKNDGNRQTTDAEVIKLIKRYITNCVDIMCMKVDATVIQTKKFEVEVYTKYLPPQLPQLTEEEINEIVVNKAGSGYTTMKDIMNHFKENYPDRYDGKAVSTIAKKYIGK